MNKASRYIQGIMLLLTIAASGCSLAANNDDYSGGDLRGINHTEQGIISFKVNGYGGRVGGNTCCILLPEKWKAGMKAHVEWILDPNPREKIKRKTTGYGFDPQDLAQHESKYQRHNAYVEIPEYGSDRCGLTVHFLTCNRVKVTTSCIAYGRTGYPISEPLHMKEPASCPK